MGAMLLAYAVYMTSEKIAPVRTARPISTRFNCLLSRLWHYYAEGQIIFSCMKHILSQSELLCMHAAAGDPSAFFTLFSTELTDIYAALRSTGVGHRQAAAGLLMPVRKLYREYIRQKPKANTAEWFKRQHKFFPQVQARGDTDGITFGNIDPREIENFEHVVHRILQKEYGMLRAMSGSGQIKTAGPAARIMRRIAIPVSILIALIIAVAGLHYWLKASNSSLQLMLTLPSHVISFSMPFRSSAEDSAAKQTHSDLQEAAQVSADSTAGKQAIDSAAAGKPAADKRSPGPAAKRARRQVSGKKSRKAKLTASVPSRQKVPPAAQPAPARRKTAPIPSKPAVQQPAKPAAAPAAPQKPVGQTDASAASSSGSASGAESTGQTVSTEASAPPSQQAPSRPEPEQDNETPAAAE
jgi:hypothetical protein